MTRSLAARLGIVLTVLIGVTAWLPSTAGAQTTINGSYVAVAPVRVLDTRVSAGPVSAYGSVRLQITGRNALPNSGITAVVMTVTVTEPSNDGFITVYPDGAARPFASNLNFRPGDTVPNLVQVKVGSDGAIDLFNGSAGTVQLIADVSGYYRGDGGSPGPGGYAPLQPSRVLDTRVGLGAAQRPVGARQTITVQMTGRGGVPSSVVSAVALNITAVDSTADGYVTAYPAGRPTPFVSNLNQEPGRIVPNLAVVPIGAGGAINLLNGSYGGSTNLVADVFGYYVAGGNGALTYVPVSPARLSDTRLGSSPVTARSWETVQVNGRNDVPNNDVSAVLLNVTVTEPTAAGFLTADAAPTSGQEINTSNVNFAAGQTVADAVLVPVASDGTIALFNGAWSGSIQIVVDVFGYVTDDAGLPPAPACTGGQLGVSAGPLLAGLGHQGLVLRFLNRSAADCTLSGYPTVAALNSTGQQIAQAQTTPNGYLGGCDCTQPPTVRLFPGQTASAMTEGDVGDGSAACVAERSLLVTPPQTSTSTRIDEQLAVCDFQVHPVVMGTSGVQR